jgi:penicillin-binding protein 1A
MTWHEVMNLAHQNLEIRPIPGASPANASRVASAKGPTADQAQTPAQSFLAGTLSRKSYEVLGGIGTLFQSVDRSMTTGKAPETPRSSAAGDARRQVAMP